MKQGKHDELSILFASVISRLDALIRLTAEATYKKNNQGLQEGDVVRMLNSAGLTPTEIAKIMGKPGRTSITAILYGKKNNTKKIRRELTEMDANGEESTKS